VPQEGTLRTVMKESFPDGLGEIAVASILKEVLKALVYIHENHYIHNDIRADNILIDSSGDIMLGGFRQTKSLQKCGQFHKSAFNLVGENIEWTAPEIMAQVSNQLTQEYKL
jgi:serine/threonine-protein kinase OSR1/STK39